MKKINSYLYTLLAWLKSHLPGLRTGGAKPSPALTLTQAFERMCDHVEGIESTIAVMSYMPEFKPWPADLADYLIRWQYMAESARDEIQIILRAAQDHAMHQRHIDRVRQLDSGRGECSLSTSHHPELS